MTGTAGGAPRTTLLRLLVPTLPTVFTSVPLLAGLILLVSDRGTPLQVSAFAVAVYVTVRLMVAAVERNGPRWATVAGLVVVPLVASVGAVLAAAGVSTALYGYAWERPDVAEIVHDVLRIDAASMVTLDGDAVIAQRALEDGSWIGLDAGEARATSDDRPRDRILRAAARAGALPASLPSVPEDDLARWAAFLVTHTPPPASVVGNRTRSGTVYRGIDADGHPLLLAQLGVRDVETDVDLCDEFRIAWPPPGAPGAAPAVEAHLRYRFDRESPGLEGRALLPPMFGLAALFQVTVLCGTAILSVARASASGPRGTL